MDTTPSTRFHPWPIKLLNGATRALNRIGLAKIDLSEQDLLTAARRETGLVRFGNENFLEPLRVLLTSLENEAQLNPAGRLQARTTTIGYLKNRLWANACFEAHPEILERRIPAPIIIVGPVRSGTTRIQRMLAADSRLQHLKAWEGFNPAPRLTSPDRGKAARFQEVKKFLAIGQRLNPGAFMAHPMEVDAADEEILLLNHSFCGMSASLLYTVPGYTNWLLDHDKTAAYRDMADLMRLVSWSRGDAENKRWVLKTPQHMLDLDVLMKTFPDAMLIFTQRDPLKTVVSTMSLAWNFGVQNTDRPLRESIRDNWLDLCELMARRSIVARKTIPASQQIDVYYDEMSRDWRKVMRRIYDSCGMTFTSEAEQAMDAWRSNSERENRHGGHRYSLEDFGISADEIDARMMFFRNSFAIPYEGK